MLSRFVFENNKWLAVLLDIKVDKNSLFGCRSVIELKYALSGWFIGFSLSLYLKKILPFAT
jgi:hypothetical protein